MLPAPAQASLLKEWIEWLYKPAMAVRDAVAASHLLHFLYESTGYEPPATEASWVAKAVRFATGYTAYRLVNIADYILDYLSKDPSQVGIIWSINTGLFASAMLFPVALTFVMEIATSLLNKPYDQKYALLELRHKERDKIIDLLREENITSKVRTKTNGTDSEVETISTRLYDYLLVQPKIKEIMGIKSKEANRNLNNNLKKISYKLNYGMAITYIKAFISLGITLSFDIFFNLILAPYIKGSRPKTSDFLGYMLAISGYAATTAQSNHRATQLGSLLDQAFDAASIDVRFWNRVSYFFNQNETLQTKLAALANVAYTLELFSLAIEKFFNNIDLTSQSLNRKGYLTGHLKACLQQANLELNAKYPKGKGRPSLTDDIYEEVVTNITEERTDKYPRSTSPVPGVGKHFTPIGTPNFNSQEESSKKSALDKDPLSITNSGNADHNTHTYSPQDTPSDDQNPPQRSSSAGSASLSRTPKSSSRALQVSAERTDLPPLSRSPRGVRRRIIMPGQGDSALQAAR